MIVSAAGLRDHVCTALERGGYRCEAAGSADDALAALARGPRFAVAICDLDLRDRPAAEMIDEIRDSYPTTAIATLHSDTSAHRGELSGIPDLLAHLPDPTSPRRLLTGVMAAIHHHSQLQEGERRQYLVRTEVETQIEQLGALTPDLARTRVTTLARLALAVDSRHAEPNDHVDRLSLLVGRLAARLGLPQEEGSLIAAAATLHDIGKLAIPASLLAKPGPFTKAERSEMERHTELGRALLAGTGDELLELAATIAWTHHERWDGSGYPRGLRGEETPLAGRIVSVATVFDALTSERVYRHALPLAEALQVIRGGSGTDFDHRIATALCDLFTCPTEFGATPTSTRLRGVMPSPASAPA